MAPEPLNASMHLPTFDQVLGGVGLVDGDSIQIGQTKAADLVDEDGTSSIWRIQHSKKLPGGSKKRCLALSNKDAQANILPLKDSVLHLDFLRKYVNFARHHVEPTLSDDARDSIANAYADLRAKADDRTLPVTARCQ